jgi:glutamate/aspartate transport system substrate-binding protein
MFNQALKYIAMAALMVAGANQAAAQAPQNTLEKIKSSGQISLGYRDASIPFSYIGKDGAPVGYSLDLCLRIVDAVKAKLELPDLKVNLVPVTAQTRTPLLTNGTIDLECGSTTHTLAREQQVDFLLTTFITGSRLAVKKGSGIKEIEDLQDKSISVGAGSSNERVAEALNKEQKTPFRISSAKDLSQAWLSLETDRVDAFMGDDVLLHGFVARSSKPDDYEITGKFLSFDPYAIMIRRNDADFRLLANTALAQSFRDGSIYEIYNKWFSTINMDVPEQLKQAFSVQAFPE